jgi:hypothetical protein
MVAMPEQPFVMDVCGDVLWDDVLKAADAAEAGVPATEPGNAPTESALPGV